MARRGKKNPGCLGTIVMFCFYIGICAFLLSLGLGVLVFGVVLYFGLIILYCILKAVFIKMRPAVQWLLNAIRIKEPYNECSENEQTLIESDPIPHEPQNTSHANVSYTEKVVQPEIVNIEQPAQQNTVPIVRSVDVPASQQVQKREFEPEKEEYKMSDDQLYWFALQCNAFLVKQERREAQKEMMMNNEDDLEDTE